MHSNIWSQLVMLFGEFWNFVNKEVHHWGGLCEFQTQPTAVPSVS